MINWLTRQRKHVDLANGARAGLVVFQVTKKLQLVVHLLLQDLRDGASSNLKSVMQEETYE